MPTGQLPVQAKPPAKKQRRPPSAEEEEEPSPPSDSTPEAESEEETFNPDKADEPPSEDEAESSGVETEDDEEFEPGDAAHTLASLTAGSRDRPPRQPSGTPKSEAATTTKQRRTPIVGVKYIAKDYKASPDPNKK